MKRLLSYVLALVASIGVYAAEVSFALDNTTKSLFQSNVVVQGLRLVSTNTITVNLYDSSTNITIFTNSAYTAKISYPTNLVTSYTNTAGIITTTVTNTGLYVGTLSVAANTNNSLPVLRSVACPANGTVELTGLSIACVKGLAATAVGSPASNATLTVIYRTLP